MGLRVLLLAALTGFVFASPLYWLSRRHSDRYSFPDRLLAAFTLAERLNEITVEATRPIEEWVTELPALIAAAQR